MDDCEIVELDGKWCMKQGSIYIQLRPQPTMGQMRFNGDGWEIHMGYPHGYDVPKFNVWGKWQNE